MPSELLDWDRDTLKINMFAATQAELEITSKPSFYTIIERTKAGPFWTLTVEASGHGNGVLDEALESAKAWWGGPHRGTADILSVLPEEHQITLRFCSVPPPEAGGTLLIYPARYLEKVRDAWLDQDWVEEIYQWLHGPFSGVDVATNSCVPKVLPGLKLRERQRASFQLVTNPVSFLSGPPGTGKTYTLGYLLAHILLQDPEAKILLVSTTNSAVDEAILAVDRALNTMADKDWRCRELVKKCKRLGSRFIASNYEKREYLIPEVNRTLIAELAILENAKPDPQDLLTYAKWKDEVEEIRATLKAHVVKLVMKSRLVAMTCTRAVFGLDDLRACPRFDYLVFDESSQVGLAHALLLVPLAEWVLFTGDKEQLKPINQAEDDLTNLLLGQSMFDLKDERIHASCFLNEQSRMAPPICNLVSRVFYNGQLKVANECLGDFKWVQFRSRPPLRDFTGHLFLLDLMEGGQWSPYYNGYIRYASASLIVENVARLIPSLQPSEILVLTPFRAQRAVLNGMLRHLAEETGRPELKKVRVSTVHRAQGQECHTVFFDPVDEGNAWLDRKDMSCLINVALSRAQAKLFLLLCKDNCKKNRTLHTILETYRTMGFESVARAQAKPLNTSSVWGIRELSDKVQLDLRETDAMPTWDPRTSGVIRPTTVDVILEEMSAAQEVLPNTSVVILTGTAQQAAVFRDRLPYTNEKTQRAVSIRGPQDLNEEGADTVYLDTAGLLGQALDPTDPLALALRARTLSRHKLVVWIHPKETRHPLWNTFLDILQAPSVEAASKLGPPPSSSKGTYPLASGPVLGPSAMTISARGKSRSLLSRYEMTWILNIHFTSDVKRLQKETGISYARYKACLHEPELLTPNEAAQLRKFLPSASDSAH